MFSRRKTRSVHDTAYTGVSRTAPNNHQPNSGALAAALTIGNAMKQQQPAQAAKKNSSIARSQSFQVAPPAANISESGGSLLKRGSRSSMQSKDKAGALGQPPRRFSANSRSSSASAGGSFNSQTQHTHVYDIDDSFNDSYLDEITEETNQTYLNNKARMNDLRLPKQNEATGNSNVIANTPVKMVKKYIPTPTGIKVIEVPELQFQKEVARSNSMRSNSLLSRSGSLRNVSLTKKSYNNVPRAASLTGTSRRNGSSSAKNPNRSVSSPLKSMHEEVVLEESLGKNDELEEQHSKYQELEKEIEEEKRLAAQIEAKRKEYERLKLERLKNEERLKELEKEVSFSDDVTEATVLHTPNEDNIPLNQESTTHVRDSFVDVPLPSKFPTETVTEEEEDEEEVPITKVPPVVDELDEKKLKDEDDEEEDVPIASVPPVVDELDDKLLKEELVPTAIDGSENKFSETDKAGFADTGVTTDEADGASPNGRSQSLSEATDNLKHQILGTQPEDSVMVSVPTFQVQEQSNTDGRIAKPFLSTLDDEKSTGDFNQAGHLNSSFAERSSVSDDEKDFQTLDPSVATELGVINQYQNLESSELLQQDNASAITIEEIDDSDEEQERSNLASQLRPQFSNKPEIIEPTVASEENTEKSNPDHDNSKIESEDTLLAPGASSNVSSKSSLFSNDSQKKPIKSALKSASSFTAPTQQQQQLQQPAAKGNAAQQAYLSLTTAENTRLNSKLSNSNLNNNPDFALTKAGNGSAIGGGGNAFGGAYPLFGNLASANKPTKRLSQQTLRKPPPQTQRGGARPHSMQHIEKQSGMSNRSLRPNSAVQPIPSHPALQPGYQSPSKLKAEALYAKAQARPHSEFKPSLAKKSSFSREIESNGHNNHGVTPRSQGRRIGDRPARTTLRDPIAPTATQSHASKPFTPETTAASKPVKSHTQQKLQSQSQSQSQLLNHQQAKPVQQYQLPKTFKSRFNDSDDEGVDSLPTRNFTSRFNDSDEDISTPRSSAPSPAVASLRRDTEPKDSSPKKEKKFKKLRKLFGSSKD